MTTAAGLGTAIVLLGKPNSGKTSTLILVYESLLRDGKQVYGGRKIKEVHAVIQVDGVKIGITSKGDIAESIIHPLEELGEKLADLVSQNCAVIICAARNSRNSKTATAVIETLEDAYEITWIEKEQNKPETDRLKADEILALVRQAIL
jgi:hypothetical protein